MTESPLARIHNEILDMQSSHDVWAVSILLQQYEDAVSHELAEKIRDMAAEADGPLPTLQLYVEGLRSAADLIDPEVD